MLISKKQLKHNMCSKDYTNPVLRCICFTDDGAVSTDGKALMVVPYPHHNEDTRFANHDVKEAADTKPERPIMVNANDAQAIAASMKDIRVSRFGKNGYTQQAMAAIVDGSSLPQMSKYMVVFNDEESIRNMLITRATVGEFPNHKTYFDERPRDMILRFNIRVLRDLLTKMIAADDSGNNIVELHISPAEDRIVLDPVQLVARGGTYAGVRAVLMPMRCWGNEFGGEK